MTFDPCDVCGCIPGNISPQNFYQWALVQLCAINTNTQGGGGVGSDVNITSYGGVATSLGQKVMASSIPVTIASNQSSFPVTIAAGTAVIGHVITDIGSTTVVSSITAALPAGTNLLGKVGIDQTTPGTTNRVAANLDQVAGSAIAQGHGTAATAIRVELPTDGTGVVGIAAGTAVIGHVITDTGSTTVVSSITAALPSGTNVIGHVINDAGSAIIGKVGIDQTTPGTTNLVALAANQSVNIAQMNGVTVSMGAGASGTGTQRVVIANDDGKTIVSTGGSAASNGNNTLVAAGTNRLKVHAFSLSTVSTTSMLCIFQSGAGGTELWRVRLQAITGSSTGANLAVPVPSWIFATASATLLNLNLSSANAVDWSVSYVDEA